MKCLVCLKNEATIYKRFGYLPCESCQEKYRKLPKIKRGIEFTPELIKIQRKEFKDDIIQPFRDGEVSKEYVDKYGNKNIIKGGKAKYVWDDGYYKLP